MQVLQEWRNAIRIPLFKKESGKVLALILLETLQSIIDLQLVKAQCGFRKGRSTVVQIRVMRQVAE